jgi:hypothetical protein
MEIKQLLKKITPEIILSGLAALLVWLILSLKGSGPIYSDELLYTDIGLNNYQVASYGNRYFHVYLQKLFMGLASSPLTGTKIFWGFLVSATALLVYWNARTFFRHSQPLHGLLAVAFFFSYRFISHYCGVTSADITAMWMVALFLTVYLVHLRTGRKYKWPLVLLGALSFLSFKTKETTLFANIFLVGLLFDQDGKFELKKIAPLVKPFLAGLLSAVGLMVLLDAIFLRAPLFSISPSTLALVFENYAYTGGFRKEPASYFTTFLLADITLPFLLYLVSGVFSQGREEQPSLKIVWLFPLVLAFFMTLNMLKIPWGFIERFYFPALPVIAILAPQWLHFELPHTHHEKRIMALLTLFGFALVIFLHWALQGYTASIKLDYGKFVDSIYQPLLLSFILGFILVVRRMNWWNILLPLTCILAFLLSPLLYNQKYIFRAPLTQSYFDQEYAPFIAFQEKIQYSSGMKLFISNDIATEYQMLTSDRNELSAMFNIFFDARTSQLNFVIGFEPEKMASTLITRQFDYVLLAQTDWQRISQDANALVEIQNQYDYFIEPDGKLLLLDKK